MSNNARLLALMAMGTPPGASGQVAIFNIPNSLNYVLATDLVARGYNLALPITVIASLPDGGIIGGNSPDAAANPGFAFDTGTGYAAGSTLQLNVAPTADIIGQAGTPSNGEVAGTGPGGRGGGAMKLRVPIVIDCRGRIGGGGGGGSWNGPSNYNLFMGWGGGYGAGCFPYETNPDLLRAVHSLGSANCYYDHAGNASSGGYQGGELGQPGNGGSSPGGAAGVCVEGNSFATWINTGTRYGLLT